MTESFTSAQTAKGEASYYAALQLWWVDIVNWNRIVYRESEKGSQEAIPWPEILSFPFTLSRCSWAHLLAMQG